VQVMRCGGRASTWTNMCSILIIMLTMAAANRYVTTCLLVTHVSIHAGILANHVSIHAGILISAYAGADVVLLCISLQRQGRQQQRSSNMTRASSSQIPTEGISYDTECVCL
jgi:hypothetical protein